MLQLPMERGRQGVDKSGGIRTDQTMTDDYELSRRKALVGLATIGAAGAGAGLGTSAYFNDEESFDGNSVTAGELDLFVAYEYTADQDGAESENLGEPTSGIVQGDTLLEGEAEAPVSYRLADLKPGDSGTLEYCPRIVDNPAWLWVNVTDVAQFENGQTEPEAEVDDSGGDPGEGEGELLENIQLTVSYCNEDGETLRELNNPADYTFADLAGEDAFLVDPDATDEAQTPYPASEGPEDQQGPCLCIDWEVPVDVGNEIQTDGLEFDVTLYAEQSRHNDDPENPFADDGTPTPTPESQ